MKKIIFILSLLSSVYSFGQCDEYYINELISGPEDRYFPTGSEIRFCPKLKGVALNGYDFDVSQWQGISTQYLTLTKNGGIAGNLVLSLDDKTLKVNFIGSPGVQLYSICLSKKELSEVKKKKDDLIILSIDSCLNINEYEKAWNLYSELYELTNYTHSTELFDRLNKMRKENLDTLMPKVEAALKDKQWIHAAKLYSDINALPTNSTYSEIRKSLGYKEMIEKELKSNYKDSMIFLDVNFQFSQSDTEFEINGKNIEFKKAIQNYLDSLPNGEYLIKISQHNDYYKTLKYEVVGKRYGLFFSEKDGEIIAEAPLNQPANNMGYPSVTKIISIDGRKFYNRTEILNYLADKNSVNIVFINSSTNEQQSLILNKGFVTLLTLPRDQKKCIKWQYGGECAEYYYENLLSGFTRDSLKSKQFGIFSIETPNYLKFKLKRNIINSDLSFYSTMNGEKLKIIDNNFYRKVKGVKSVSIKTERKPDISPNTLVIGKHGDLEYSVNNEVNYLEKDRVLYWYYPISETYLNP